MIELSRAFVKWAHQPSLKLPLLPKIVRYYENFSDSYSELTNLGADSWTVYYDGKQSDLQFSNFPPSLRHLLKSWCAANLPTYSPRTVDLYLRVLNCHLTPALLDLIASGPLELHSNWCALLGIGTPYEVFAPLSNILHFLCEHSVRPWGVEWDDLITLQPYPKKDKYAAVRSGDVFISSTEEQSYVKYLDSIVSCINEKPEALTSSELLNAAILLIAYQFGMRAKQIAMLRLQDVSQWEDNMHPAPAIHLTFQTIKQPNRGKVFPLHRKVKRDWAPLFAEYRRRLLKAGNAPTCHFFSLTPVDVQQVVFAVTERLGTRRGAACPS